MEFYFDCGNFERFCPTWLSLIPLPSTKCFTPVVDETLGTEENFPLAVDDDLTLMYEASPETKYRVEVQALNAIGDGEKTTEEPTTALQGRKLLSGAQFYESCYR